MKKLVSRSPMFTEAAAKKSGLKLILEILVCLLIFMIASVVESVFLMPAMFAWIVQDGTIFQGAYELGQSIANGGEFVSAFQDYMTNVMNVLNNMPNWLMILQLFLTVAVIVVVLIFCVKIQKRSLASVGFTKKHALRDYGIGALIGAATLSASLGINVLFGAMKVETTKFNIVVILIYLIGYALQGASEEILCRGYLMVSIGRKHSLTTALIVSSLFFAVLHLGNPGITPLAFINLFLSGIMFGLYVIKTGNLWGACAMHSLWNFFQGNFFGVQVSGLSFTESFFRTTSTAGMGILNGGSFGLEGGLGVTIVEVITILIILFAMPNKFLDDNELGN